MFVSVVKLGGRDADELCATKCRVPSFLSLAALRFIITPTGNKTNMPGEKNRENFFDASTGGRSDPDSAAPLHPLAPEFFLQPTEIVARRLIGCLLVHREGEQPLIARVVETEAYLAEGDPGCHAARGRTERNAPMFGPPGTLYVYLIYGMHLCMNIVTAEEGRPEAVLLRAAEPLMGIETMRGRRGRDRLEDLCSGPAKLTEALGITLKHNRADITCRDRSPGDLFVAGADPAEEIAITTRIGLGEGAGDDLMLRYMIAQSPWVSAPPRAGAPVIYEKR